MIITNTIDTDLIVLSYVEPSILAYMKTINSDSYKLINNILDNNFIFKLTKALINTPHFLENNFDNINKTDLLNTCVKNELNLDGLKRLHHIKCEPNKRTFEYAARNGNFDILKWMFDNNFPKDEWTFACAAKYDNLDILKWMLDNKFPKDICAFGFAVQNGNLNNLKWMLHNNFPYHSSDFDRYINLCKKENTES